jgi:hypothetical protein
MLPLEYVPATLRDATIGAYRVTQAPVPLAFGTALAAAAVACQGGARVRLPNGKLSPLALYITLVADSGTGKSACESVLFAAIREQERLRSETLKDQNRRHLADTTVWTIGHKELSRALSKAIRRSVLGTCQESKISEITVRLEQHLHSKPKKPVVSRLLLDDATIEALQLALRDSNGSVAIISDEAWKQLSGHGGREMPILTQLWDGHRIVIDRASAESFVVESTALTMCLMIQGGMFDEYLKRNGSTSRDSGYLARTLLIKPMSTQGFRMFQEPNSSTADDLAVFNRRLEELLAQNIPGRTYDPIEFSEDAKKVWVAMHDEIEVNQRFGGALDDVRDAASKVMDNVGRIAAIFHQIEGRQGPIQADTATQACQIGDWFLRQFWQLFSKHAKPPQAEQDGLEILRVVRARGMAGGAGHVLPRRQLIQYVTRPMRDSRRIDDALQHLVTTNRAWLMNIGRTTCVTVHVHI